MYLTIGKMEYQIKENIMTDIGIEIPTCITNFANSLEGRHPDWNVDTFVSIWGELRTPTVCLAVYKKREDGEWWESPIRFDLFITEEKMSAAEDYLAEWEEEFAQKVGL